jgi:hypothetical protein
MFSKIKCSKIIYKEEEVKKEETKEEEEKIKEVIVDVIVNIEPEAEAENIPVETIYEVPEVISQENPMKVEEVKCVWEETEKVVEVVEVKNETEESRVVEVEVPVVSSNVSRSKIESIIKQISNEYKLKQQNNNGWSV